MRPLEDTQADGMGVTNSAGESGSWGAGPLPQLQPLGQQPPQPDPWAWSQSGCRKTNLGASPGCSNSPTFGYYTENVDFFVF